MNGCLNQDMVEENIKVILRKSSIKSKHIIFLMSIDEFTNKKNSIERKNEEEVLIEIGENLKKIVREGDVIGRVGNSQFLIFLSNVSEHFSIKQKVEELAFVVADKGLYKKEEFEISCSIGVYFFGNRQISYEDIYAQVKKAFCAAKSKGNNQYCISIQSEDFETRVERGSIESIETYVRKEFKTNMMLKAMQILQISNNNPAAINTVLEMIGQELQVSRCYMFEIEDDGKHFSNTYEWCDKGIKPEIDNFKSIPFSEYAYLFSSAREDGIIACEDTTEFFGEYQKLNEEQGVKSFLQGYVKIANTPQMMLGVDQCYQKRKWTNQEIRTLIYLSNLLGMFSKKVVNINLLSQFNKFKNLAEIDVLTGLLTKEKFYSNTKKMIDGNPKHKFFFLLLDIDKFQSVNSFFGMEEGDKLLKIIANKFEEFRQSPLSTCGRLGGDIFCLCQVIERPMTEILDSFVEDIKETINNYRADYNLNMSIGVYELKENDRNIPMEAIYAKAFMAAKNLKEIQDTVYMIYQDDMELEKLHEQEIINDMYLALSENQFEVYLQPKILLKNEELIGAEALVRWNHPIKGFISPAEFVPIFEKNGLITKIDYFVWESVFAFIKEQMQKYKTVIPIAVNVSRVDLFHKNIIDYFEEFLYRYEIEPKYLHIEITESAYTENYTEVINVINKLKQLGFHIEMDDFGTGYSSLNMFSEMIVDTIKLDMKFLNNLQDSGDKNNILSFIISLAKHFNIPVVAEGIETEAQKKFLKNIGCDIGQGYLFAKPMSMDDFIKYLDERQMKEPVCKGQEEIRMIELSDILYPHAKVHDFFNKALGAACIFEVLNNRIKIIRCNEECFEILGITESNSEYKNKVMQMVHKDDVKIVIMKIEEAKETKKSISFCARITNNLGKDSLEEPQYDRIRIRFKNIYTSIYSDIYLTML